MSPAMHQERASRLNSETGHDPHRERVNAPNALLWELQRQSESMMRGARASAWACARVCWVMFLAAWTLADGSRGLAQDLSNDSAASSSIVAREFGATAVSAVNATENRIIPEAHEPIDLLADGLSAWHISGCKVSVNDGVLRLDEGDGFARVAWELGDFEFEFQWRPLKDTDFDSGIYFRAPDPRGSPWPARYQINLRQGGEGKLLKADSPDVPEGLVKPGEWNRMKLRVVGEQATLWINDRMAWEVAGIDPTPGHLGFQSEVPLGGSFEFRDFKLTELDATALFNGKDLTGWTAVGSDPNQPNWSIEEGRLVCRGGAGGWLRREDECEDVALILEYRLPKRGNSGVYLRVPADGNHHGDGAGVEIQILDDAGYANDGLKDYQFSASLYDFAGAEPRVSREVGQWNVLEVQTLGGRYRIRHNGETVVDVQAEQVPGLSQRRTAGYFGLQNHGEPVEFRRVRQVARPVAPAPPQP